MVQVGTATPATPKVHKYIAFDTSTFVAHITLNHPPYNVLTVPLMVEVAEAVESLNGRNDIKCIVLDSSQKAFCAGISLDRPCALATSSSTKTSSRTRSRRAIWR